MPSEWSSKRERQYEHVKESQRREGRSEERAKMDKVQLERAVAGKGN